MSDDDILKVARECFFATTFGFDEPVITFARRIAAMQREIDAGICEALDGKVVDEIQLTDDVSEAIFADPKDCAAAIREQSDD